MSAFLICKVYLMLFSFMTLTFMILIIMTIYLGAVMMSMHLDRWNQQNLTSREIVCLEDDTVVSKFAGGPLQSLIMWKLLALFLAEKKARFVENSLLVLRRDRTVDMEVQEVLKTQKVDRLRQIASTLRSIVCRRYSFLIHLLNKMFSL